MRMTGPSAANVPAVRLKSAGDDQALIAAPGIADAEMMEAVEERREGVVASPAFSTTPNRPEAPVKSRFQSACPGSLSSAG